MIVFSFLSLLGGPPFPNKFVSGFRDVDLNETIEQAGAELGQAQLKLGLDFTFSSDSVQ